VIDCVKSNERRRVQEFNASIEERVEEPEYLSLEGVGQKTQPKTEISSHPIPGIVFKTWQERHLSAGKKKHIYASNT